MDVRRSVVVAVVASVIAMALVGGAGVAGVFGSGGDEVGGAADGRGDPAGPTATTLSTAEREVAYRSNLDFILESTVRNTSHDDSPYLDVPSDELVLADHLGPRADYLGNPGGNPESSFPVEQGGQFRAGCEFSHFAYDDPLVFPDQPGASHLHMFFGNTHVNAYSTYETLIDSGSSTCNGQELNRTGYWVPAMFDGEGNVRIPERVVVYYKGEGWSRGDSVVFPDGAAMIAKDDLNTVSPAEGGAEGKFSFVCSDQWSGQSQPAANTMPVCDGDQFFNEYGVEDEPHAVLEMNVKFPQCWSGEAPADWATSYGLPPVGGWYGSDCQGDYAVNFPNIEYFVDYRVDLGETTEDWYLASDIDMMNPDGQRRQGGESVHGDWWGGWNREVNQMWLDNCVNFSTDTPSGCGFGYLTDGGPDAENPIEGPALRYRPQYTGPHRIPAELIYEQLCSPLTDRQYRQPSDAAFCVPPT